MVRPLDYFERIVRKAYLFTEREESAAATTHPFELREIHSQLPRKVKKLFDDGHYAQATFEAFKFVDKLIARHFQSKESGCKLMMAAFDKEKGGIIKLNELISRSDQDEQDGFRFIFAGSVQGIRNPRGHEVDLEDDVNTCLDHLSLASMLIRRLEAAGYEAKLKP